MCVACLMVVVLLFVFTKNYGGAKWKKVDKKQHKLWMVYDMAMFLVDKPFRRLLQKNSQMLDEKFKSLYVKDRVSDEKYLYIVSKVSIVIVLVSVSAIVGMIAEFSMNGEKNRITYINRKNFYEGETVYHLQVEAGDEEESIEIVVNPQSYTDSEISKLLEGYKEELIAEMLGDNASQDLINKPLNLVTSIGELEVPVVWEVSDDGIINSDGSIGINVEPSGSITTIRAVLSLKSVTVTHEIVINVFPAEEGPGLNARIQKIIDECDEGQEKILLPDEVDNKKVSFFIKQDDSIKYLFPLGFVASIVIFVFKDKELDGQIKKRNQQLQMDYPEVVSKIMLLCTAGMSTRRAWEMTIKSSGEKREHYVYKEMRMTLGKINGGISERVAYEQFGKRCGVHCYIRFANIISQNLKRGTSDMCQAMKIEIDNAFQERKNAALKKGEEAGTKLLGPMIIMLIIGLGIIVIPAFMSVNI